MIKVNDTIPESNLQYFENGKMITASTTDLFSGKKVVLFALPGAFTPTCSNTHLPGYVVNADAFTEKGVDSIICLSVNDAFVMDAWGKSQNAEHIIMAADGNADFSQKLGLSADTGSFGGIRSLRYAMIVDNGVVTTLNVEAPQEFLVSDADTMLEAVS
ncbi:MAG: peroxiredoxin [Psychrobacter glaciei]|jgi:peroxiredoxin